jgi:hypothetical protein
MCTKDGLLRLGAEDGRLLDESEDIVAKLGIVADVSPL